MRSKRRGKRHAYRRDDDAKPARGFVKATRPIVKAERGQLVYNMPLLIEKMLADNAYDALTRIPGVNELNGNINYAGKELTLIINGKPTTLNYAQLAERLKAMPASQLAKAKVMLAAPARLHVRGMVINLITKDSDRKIVTFTMITGRYDVGLKSESSPK